MEHIASDVQAEQYMYMIMQISLEQLWEKRKNKGIRFGISYIGVSWKNLK